MDLPSIPKTPTLSAELKEIINKKNMLTTRTRMKVLNALDEIQQQNITEKEESLRVQAIQEILSTEVKYLRQLEIIMEFFMLPMVQKKLLNYDLYTTLFENVEILYSVNGELLKELKENPENVAQAFCKLAPFFKLYSVYAYNYKRSLMVLQEIQQHHPATAEFIASQETRPEVNNKLSSLLITPIQRVPRYKLLLKEVLRHTIPRQQDYIVLQASLVEIEKVATHINFLVAEYEDAQRLLELQKHIVGRINLIKPGRKLIRQGPLMRVSRRGNTSFRRHFVLLSDILLYCKGNSDSLTICCLLPLNKCKIERVLSNGLFKVVCIQESLLLYSENGDSEAWIEELQAAVKKYIECRQTLRKDSSARIPMRRVRNIQKEDFIEKRCKKKRPLSINDTVEPLSDNSNIIYVNKDIESETSGERSKLFLAFKRFKRDSTVVEPSVKERIRFWIYGIKRRSLGNNFFHQTKNNVSNSESNDKNQYSIIKQYKDCKNDIIINNCNINNEICTENVKGTEESQYNLTLKGVGKFFSSIRNALKDIFNRNL